MKKVNVEDAIGMILAHDLTMIVPGQFKGSRFSKGHKVEEVDVETLLNMGKKHVYVIDTEEKGVHEDEAALRIAEAVAGEGLERIKKGEGKVEIRAADFGLLKVDKDKLFEVVSDEETVLATIHGDIIVNKGDKIGATRVVPLYVSEEKVARTEDLCKEGPVLWIKPLKPHKVGVVTTGSEVYTGRIKDAFGPVLKEKFTKLGSSLMKQVFADDDDEMISASIKELIAEGAEIICVTGGMSVDPDDRTPLGIRRAGGEIVTYGTPALPGAMFMLAYIGQVPVMGLPGCVMYSKVSVFDLIAPRILAGERPTREEIKRLAYGGLCLDCEVCTYPVCGFGKSL